MLLFYMFFISFILLSITNQLIKKTEWYNNQFEDVAKFNKIPLHLQVVNLGSNNGKYSLDYSEMELVGMNWAIGPQSIIYDNKILKTFIHRIDKGCHLLIVISPFHSIFNKLDNKNSNDNYYLFLPKELIPDYSIFIHIKMRLKSFFPIYSLIVKPKLLISLFRKLEYPQNLSHNPLNEYQLNIDSIKWIDDWKRQFKIENFELSLSEKYLQIQDYNREILKNTIELAKSHGLKPVIVLPPITPYLLKYLTPDVRQIYIYDFLESVVKITGVKLLDHMDDKRFQDSDLYFNSFFLNKKGRKEFTQEVLKSLQTFNS